MAQDADKQENESERRGCSAPTEAPAGADLGYTPRSVCSARRQPPPAISSTFTRHLPTSFRPSREHIDEYHWTLPPEKTSVNPVKTQLQKRLLTPRTAAYIRSLADDRSTVCTSRTLDQSTARELLPTTKEKTNQTASAPDGSQEEKAKAVPDAVAREAASKRTEVVHESKRVKRIPWVGPLYTKVHSPPYEPLFGKVENLFGSRGEPLLTPAEEAAFITHIMQADRYELLKYSGVTHPKHYPYRAPATNSYLEDYPVPPPQHGHSYKHDPLLRSKLAPQDNYPYIRVQGNFGQPLNFFHNDMLLDNVMDTSIANVYCPGTTPMYADIPNFGRVQGVYMRQNDGTTYPLVTLPKMTPHDICKVLSKVQPKPRRRPSRFWENLLCCGVSGGAD